MQIDVVKVKLIDYDQSDGVNSEGAWIRLDALGMRGWRRQNWLVLEELGMACTFVVNMVEVRWKDRRTDVRPDGEYQHTLARKVQRQ